MVELDLASLHGTLLLNATRRLLRRVVSTPISKASFIWSTMAAKDRPRRCGELIAEIAGADLERLLDIEKRHLQHNGETLDLDADSWLPRDPSQWRRPGEFGCGSKLKAWWQAQCWFRDLPEDGTILALQTRLRNRDKTDDGRLALFNQLTQLVKEAQWTLLSPERKFMKDQERMVQESADGATLLRINEPMRGRVIDECRYQRVPHTNVRVPRFLWAMDENGRYSRHQWPNSMEWTIIGRDVERRRQISRRIQRATEDDFEVESNAIPHFAIQWHAGLVNQRRPFFDGPRLTTLDRESSDEDEDDDDNDVQVPAQPQPRPQVLHRGAVRGVERGRVDEQSSAARRPFRTNFPHNIGTPEGWAAVCAQPGGMKAHCDSFTQRMKAEFEEAERCGIISRRAPGDRDESRHSRILIGPRSQR